MRRHRFSGEHGGWRFTHAPRGAFPAMDFAPDPVELSSFAAEHAPLSPHLPRARLHPGPHHPAPRRQGRGRAARLCAAPDRRRRHGRADHRLGRRLVRRTGQRIPAQPEPTSTPPHGRSCGTVSTSRTRSGRPRGRGEGLPRGGSACGAALSPSHVAAAGYPMSPDSLAGSWRSWRVRVAYFTAVVSERSKIAVRCGGSAPVARTSPATAPDRGAERSSGPRCSPEHGMW